tara:strand:+ start:2569 stop:3168 length:600 start_codon:yes stop_codon:yes gene_type:complete
MKIALDLDEVLVPMISHLNVHYEKQYNRKIKVPLSKAVEYNFATIFDITPREAQWLVYSFYNSDEHKKIKPLKGTKETVLLWKSLGYDLYIITSRQIYSRKSTYDLVRRSFGKDVFTDIIYCNSHSLLGDKIEKSDVCVTLGIDMLIDDNVSNLHGLPSHTEGILFTGPPNSPYPWARFERLDQQGDEQGDHFDMIDYK